MSGEREATWDLLTERRPMRIALPEVALGGIRACVIQSSRPTTPTSVYCQHTSFASNSSSLILQWKLRLHCKGSLDTSHGKLRSPKTLWIRVWLFLSMAHMLARAKQVRNLQPHTCCH